MPFVNVKTIKGALTDEEKKQVVERITDVMVDIEGRGNANFRQFVWVLLEEEQAPNWGIGGQQVSMEALESARSQ